MLYIIYAHDKPNAVDLRMATRPTHLEFIDGSDNCRIAGPLLNDAGEPIGSMLIIEAESLDAAKAWAASDPYAKAGLFAGTEVHPWKWVIGAPQE